MDQTIPLLLSSTSSEAAVNNKKKIIFINYYYLFFCWLTMRIGLKHALHRSNRATRAVAHEAYKFHCLIVSLQNYSGIAL